MDALREALAKFGNAWTMEVPRTLLKLYEPLQAQQNQKYGSEIKVEKALKYGPDPRNRIDVYSPASGSSGISGSGAGRPVVVFIHGGGLVAGDNDATPNIYSNIGEKNPPSQTCHIYYVCLPERECVCMCVGERERERERDSDRDRDRKVANGSTGNYFTKNGCVTCLATYRLALQGGHHPDGADDVAGALAWVRANIAGRGGDPSRVVAVGQSAGGYHLFTALTTGRLDAPPGLLRGAVTLSAPFTVGLAEPDRAAAMMDWFRTDRAFEVNGRYGPLALFRQEFFFGSSSPGAGGAPRERLPCELLMFVGEHEADEILEGTWEFVAEYKKRFGKLPILEVLKGHNHVSYCFGLGLEAPEYEKVGKRLLDAIGELTQ